MTIFKKARLLSPLTLDDVRFLINHKSWSALSRIEAGKRNPSKEVAIGYHVLFNIPLDELFTREIEQFKVFLEGYTEARVEQLKEEGAGMLSAERIVYLEQLNHAN